MSAKGFLGSGDVYIARYDYDTGVFSGYEGKIECSKLEIKPNSEKKEMTSKGKSTYGQVVASAFVPKPAELHIEFPEVSKSTLETALFGISSVVNQAAASVTDEAITAKTGFWVQLANENLAASGLVVTNSSGSTTYVLGVDYEVNYRLGTIKAIQGGAIADGASLKVDYTAIALSGTKIKGAKRNQVRFKLMLDGANFVDGNSVKLEIFDAVGTPDGAFDFLSSDFEKVVLKASMMTPAGKDTPFEVTYAD